MNTYIECFRHGKLKKRYHVSQIEKSGRYFLKSSLELDGYKTEQIESEDELETGTL